MRAHLESIANGYPIYVARRPEYETHQAIPFRVSPEPLTLSPDQAQTVIDLGEATTSYFATAGELYSQSEELQTLLNRGKPEVFTDTPRSPRYLFIRPDLIITPTGFSMCEIETSPFGLALADILNRGYARAGFETMADEQLLTQHVQQKTARAGTLVYSDKTASYAGQLAYLADVVFSGEDREWRAHHVYEHDNQTTGPIYRGLYLSEYLSDLAVQALLSTQLQRTDTDLLPSPTPQLEEKAILALLWDKRFATSIKQAVGEAAFTLLQRTVPPTWIVGQEEHFEPGLPNGSQRSVDLASLSAAQRKFVLKSSGFRGDASWAEGVQFLHKKSASAAKLALQQAADDKSGLHVVQTFDKASETTLPYETAGGQAMLMPARIRLTPYFAMAGHDVGRLITIKATGCEKTDFIHASSASINTAVC